ncbi:hypothetical protein M5J20_00610 [Corynebacterium sp. TA-R-1]|uniref:Low molecular weight antigen MTB12-like C-terminal domain-containing protein n=2 Tax=Corynebacterium stercoris TaxID=2943490 RepID=A0ABT1G163_9CORY|nr:hypothetical protein [Corynebacterium stercoris]
MYARKIAAATVMLGLGVGIAACSGGEGTETTTSSAATSEAPAATAAAPVAEMPSASELNGVIQRAADPNLPLEERMLTVQGGQQVPELFDVMTQSQLESGATFQVVDPVLPGFEPYQVLAAVNLVQPGAEPTLINDVTFVHEEGHWKLSQQWACNLISSTLPPEQVPAMCSASAPVAPPPVDAPAPAEAPAPAPAPGL